MELRSDSRPHRSHRGNGNDRHKPDFWRCSSGGPCSGSHLDVNHRKQVKLKFQDILKYLELGEHKRHISRLNFLRDIFSRSSVHQSHQGSLYARRKTGLEKCRGGQRNGDRAQRGCCRPAQSEQEVWWQTALHLMDQYLVLLESWSALWHLEHTEVIT